MNRVKAQGLEPKARGDSKEDLGRCAVRPAPCAAHDLTCVMIGLCLVFVIILSCTNTVWAYSPEDCIRCHRKSSQESILRISVEDFKSSVHGATFSCPDCHKGIEDVSHQRLEGSGAVSCRECHEQENRHGAGARGDLRPKCYSCHTKHLILEKGDPASSVHTEALKSTCGTCHPEESGRLNYLSWFPSLQIVSHGKQDFGKAYDRGNCLGCHQGSGTHGEKAPINRQECYKCHNAMIGYMHPKADFRRQPGVFASAWIYQLFLAGLLWGGYRFYTRNGRHKKRGSRC